MPNPTRSNRSTTPVNKTSTDIHYIAIVDPYSSGKLLAPEFEKLGIACIAIHSQPNNRESFSDSFIPQHFHKSIDWNENVSELAQQLENYSLLNIIAGTESGVTLADRLSNQLGFLCNDINKLGARRDKYLMQETLKKAGLRSIRQYRSDSLEEVSRWALALGTWPIVIKPCSSAGSDGVSICFSLPHLHQAFNAILGHTNLMGGVNDSVLVQEFVEGTEYVIDTVSLHGQHFTSNLCVYKKDISKGAPVYQEMHFIEPNKPELQAIVRYTHNVLDALGIQHGPSHSEVLLTNTGPVLVETGARIHGGYTPYTVQQISSHSQLELTAQCYAKPSLFQANTQLPCRFHKHAAVFFFTHHNQGIVEDLPYKAVLKSLASHFDTVWNTRPGDYLGETKDLYTSPGWVVLTHASKMQFEEDFETVRKLNDSGALVKLEKTQEAFA